MHVAHIAETQCKSVVSYTQDTVQPESVPGEDGFGLFCLAE